MKQDAFYDVERTIFTTCEGDIELPIFFNELSSITCLFLADYNRVQKIFQGSGLTPCKLINSKAAVSLTFFQYRQCSIGAYIEVALTTLTHPDNIKPPLFTLPQGFKSAEKWKIGAYVHDLPVTSKVAKASGWEVWGLEKFLVEIDFLLSKRKFRGTIKDPKTNGNILTIEGQTGPFGLGKKIKAMDIVIFTHFQNDIYRTVIDVEGKSRCNINLGFMGGLKLKVGNSDRKMAQHLRDMGLDGAVPITTFISEVGRARINKGIPARQFYNGSSN